MAAKVDQKVLSRLQYLLNQGLTQTVVGERLGISVRTVRVYVRHLKTGAKPYQIPDVQSNSSPEET